MSGAVLHRASAEAWWGLTGAELPRMVDDEGRECIPDSVSVNVGDTSGGTHPRHVAVWLTCCLVSDTPMLDDERARDEYGNVATTRILWGTPEDECWRPLEYVPGWLREIIAPWVPQMPRGGGIW